jgi:hypothetical protein
MTAVPILLSAPMPAFVVRHVRQRVEEDLLIHPEQVVSQSGVRVVLYSCEVVSPWWSTGVPVPLEICRSSVTVVLQ